MSADASSRSDTARQAKRADIDDILIAIGGVGRYQLTWFGIVVAGMLSGAFINYSLYYFTLSPIYLCENYGGQTGWTTCTQKEICDMTTNKLRTDVKHKVYYDDNRSLHNWLEQFDLTCASDETIGRIGSSFFVGTFLGSFILPRAADVVGRKPMFMLGLVIYICVVIGLMVASTLFQLMALLVLSGVGECGRYYVAYVYVIEIFPVYN